MGKNLVQKILDSHLVSGKRKGGEEIAISIDQTLTQDATGTMAYLQFEAMGIPKVKTKLSVSYVDHNMLQTGFENFDDHLFLQSIAKKYGVYFSKPGNGICHQVHLERFGVPGETLLGSDSHTPTCGGLGMIAIGAGGLDVAIAMAGGSFYITMPKVVLVKLSGTLQPWVTAKDVILELLRRLTVKGGVGKIFEYGGEGVKTLSVTERATITNMGAELGALTSLFPSDAQTKKYLKMQGREAVWKPLKADASAKYDDVIEIDLSTLEPLIARPHSPDNVCKVSEIKGTKVQQVCIGSCTNSSYHDLMVAAAMLKGRKVHSDVSLTISPGSKQVLEMIAKNGALADMIAAGARVIEVACGPCIGMGQAPPSGGVSVRSFNRNFEGRSGTADAQVFLVSPETAIVTAINGVISDPREFGEPIIIKDIKRVTIDDSMVIPPSERPEEVTIIRGPNIKPLPKKEPMPDTLTGDVLLKVGDNITTDHIMPAGAKVLPLRSNIPAISEFVFEKVDKEFVSRAKEKGGGFLIGGVNYGQGSSREHAALAPMYLGVKAVIAKSFARIHRANLVNFGILPLTFEDESDYNLCDQGDSIELPDIKNRLTSGGKVIINNLTKNKEIKVKHTLTPREIDILCVGGLLNYQAQSSK
ncbi:aconitate hydratase [Candidatus Brocadia sinica]|uniref:Aconitate hydratase A n=1 Tax=Candidatus Brocadia sinica JPN1 TaxID=1197129 RepID=A0ABQ0JZJ6_9BACT|nr:aconitate hydratase [Candidatus Brocadia sinica]MBL1169150.1 aconitate hydratase [Candidatus Brocadia sp. AMX1]NOG41996.1 aconitate hydratase [Planctomycetota bacterium]GAN34150.1 aconitate hydratase1 [Candidatus Brocadia sinica JPN1]GIK14414.1 MAG: aconitate hydratase [Candidatus Brocadia sinica]GJQ19317.1 MAG: aconitate hydratase [Candidatus Brocadia sinica]